MNSGLKIICLLMSLLLVSQPVSAAESLLSLYQAALHYDAQYQEAFFNTEADSEEINKARALFYPKAQLGGSIGRGNTDRTTQTFLGPIESQLNYDTKNIALSVKQPLFNKETMATYRSAQAYVKSKTALLQSEDSSLITRIADAYFELLYAQEKVRVAQNQIDSVGQQLDQANKRFQHGTGTVTEVSEAEASLDSARADLLEAKNSTDTYQLILSNITGHEVGELAKLNPDSTLNLSQDFEQLGYWLKSARENNPEINAARYALDMAQREVEKKQAGHYPTLDLVGARSYSENDSNNTLGSKFDTTTISLQFNMPLYTGGYVNASVRQSLDKVEAAEENLNLKTREVNTNIKKHFQQVQSGLLSIQAYRQAVKSSEIALDGTTKSFAGGLRTNIDVLNAQQRLYENRLKLSQSYYVLVNDILNIKHFSGMLNETQLQSFNQFFMAN